MAGKTTRRVFTLSEGDNEALEKLRASLGLRSHAAVVRKALRELAKARL